MLTSGSIGPNEIVAPYGLFRVLVCFMLHEMRGDALLVLLKLDQLGAAFDFYTVSREMVSEDLLSVILSDQYRVRLPMR